LARTAGLGQQVVVEALSRLQAAGLVVRTHEGWRLTPREADA
jgi:DNA-binding GntR family transcriptional regulator